MGRTYSVEQGMPRLLHVQVSGSHVELEVYRPGEVGEDGGAGGVERGGRSGWRREGVEASVSRSVGASVWWRVRTGLR